jgi:hypothetical protein
MRLMKWALVVALATISTSGQADPAGRPDMAGMGAGWLSEDYEVQYWKKALSFTKGVACRAVAPAWQLGRQNTRR